MNRLFFDELGFVVADDPGVPEDLLADNVLRRRRGSCVGLAVIYVLLGRELGFPIHAVAAPGHVFARYSDERDAINIELLQRGARLSNEWYVDRYRIPPSSVKSGIFLQPLTDTALLGIVHSNLGAFYSRVGDYGSARQHYRVAIAMAPVHPGAYYNWGLDLLAQGRPRDAVRKLTMALELYPTDIWALKARATAYCSAGKRRRAQEDLTRARALGSDRDLPTALSPGSDCAPIRPE